MSAENDTQKDARSTTATGKESAGFSDEGRVAMMERAQKLKTDARSGRH